MNDTQTISATYARNNFFQLLDQSLLEHKTFIIKKGRIPVAHITPPQPTTTSTDTQKQQLQLLNKIAAFRQTLPPQPINAVKLIHQLRDERMNKYVK